MTIPKVVTAFTHNPEWALEKMDYSMPSATVPDEAYTIEDLMKRHRAGLFTDVKTPIFMNDDSYNDEDASLDDIDFEKMRWNDLVDQAEHLNSLQTPAFNGEEREERPGARRPAAAPATKTEEVPG